MTTLDQEVRLNEADVAKVLGNVEAGLIRDAPGTETLIRVRLGRNDGSEEVHAPLGALGLAGVDVEQRQRDLRLAGPRLAGLVEGRLGREAVDDGVRDVKVVKGGASRAILGRVVDKGLVRDVVGVDLVLKVGRRIVGAFVDEGLHDLVLVDGVVGALRRVEEEVDLVARRELEAQLGVGVAKVNLGAREALLVRHRLVVLDGADLGAGGHVDAGHAARGGGSGNGGGGQGGDQMHFYRGFEDELVKLKAPATAFR